MHGWIGVCQGAEAHPAGGMNIWRGRWATIPLEPDPKTGVYTAVLYLVVGVFGEPGTRFHFQLLADNKKKEEALHFGGKGVIYPDGAYFETFKVLMDFMSPGKMWFTLYVNEQYVSRTPLVIGDGDDDPAPALWDEPPSPSES